MTREKEGEVRVRVEPDARRDAVREESPLSLIVSVRDPAAGNRANTRVCELVARHYGVTDQSVRIVRGHRGRIKHLHVENLL